LVYVLNDLLLVRDFHWYRGHVGLVFSGRVEVCSKLMCLRSAAAGGERAATGGASRALAERREAAAVGHEGVGGSVGLEDDRWRSSSEMLSVLNPVLGDVCLDRYFDSGELRCHHNGRHESHFLLSSGDLSSLGIITSLGVRFHYGSVTAPSDGLSAVAVAQVSGGATAASLLPSPLIVISITGTQVCVKVGSELHGALVRISGSIEYLWIISSRQLHLLSRRVDIDSKVIDEIR